MTKNEIMKNGYQVLEADLDFINKSEYKTSEVMIVTNYLRCVHLSRKLQYKICFVEDLKELTINYVINYIKFSNILTKYND